MTGQRIKEILAAEGISLAELSRLLGYEGDQRLHNALRSDNVKSGLLEDIARVTNKSVCFSIQTIMVVLQTLLIVRWLFWGLKTK